LLLVAGCLLVTGCWLLVAGCWLQILTADIFIINMMTIFLIFPATSNPQLATRNLL
jgi:hypothetical protein